MPVVAVGIMLLVGCSATDSPSSAPVPSAGQSSVASTQDSCGAAGETVKQHLKSAQVEAVTVVGQCTTVVVATMLADDDAVAGNQLCEAAGEVAYTGDINSVRVLSKSGKELSNGITGMRCLP